MNHANDIGNHDFDFGKTMHMGNADDRLPPLDTFTERYQISLAPLQHRRRYYRSSTREVPKILDHRKMRCKDWSHWLGRAVGQQT